MSSEFRDGWLNEEESETWIGYLIFDIDLDQLFDFVSCASCRLCQQADRRLAEAAARRLHPHLRGPLREELGPLRRLLPAHPLLLLEGRRGQPPGGHTQVLHRALQENVPGKQLSLS